VQTILRALAAKAAVCRFSRDQHARQRCAEVNCCTRVADRSTQKHPAAFAAAFGKTGIAQDFDMARDARLALTQNLRKLTHSEFHAGEQPHDPEAGRICKGAKRFKNSHLAYIKKTLYYASHIKISLYGLAVGSANAVWYLPCSDEQIRMQDAAADRRVDQIA
jgi:hypothetical protein